MERVARRRPRSSAAISNIAMGLEGVSDVVLLEGFNVLNSTNQTNSATAFVILKEWSDRTKPELRARPCRRSFRQPSPRKFEAPWLSSSSPRRSAA